MKPEGRGSIVSATACRQPSAASCFYNLFPLSADIYLCILTEPFSAIIVMDNKFTLYLILQTEIKKLIRMQNTRALSYWYTYLQINVYHLQI